MKRISNYVFSRVPSVIRPRSTFDKGRTYKTTFDAGYLIPFFIEDILPGDTMVLNLTAFARMATLIVPYMDNVWMDFHFFFCPNRLVWENWQRFCGEQDNPTDSTDYLVPEVTVTPTVGSLWDYLGLPVGQQLTVDSLVPRMYNLVWNEWFRDENLQNSLVVDVDDGPDTASDYVLRKRGKRKTDPFTPALPWPQKGPGVELSLAGDLSVGCAGVDSTGKRVWNQAVLGSTTSTTFTADASTPISAINLNSVGGLNKGTGNTNTVTLSKLAPSSGAYGVPLFADLADATAITINSLREAFQVQKWYEQLARGGSRYVELVLSMFGVHTGDARLQRPEYLGGGTIPVNVHAVAQTSAGFLSDFGTETPQGNLAAYAVAGSSGIGFSKSFVEHGYVLGLVSVRADYNYQQGIDRHWSRRTKFDFYWPAFAHLGEVDIKNKEIYYSNDPSVDNQAFGYQERWYEYRYGVNKITGKLRSGVAGSLDIWHLAQYFTSLPTLNSTFIEENPPITRVLAVSDEPQFIFDSVIKCKMSRVLPVYSTPGLVDHF